jgi:hypothetical protein
MDRDLEARPVRHAHVRDGRLDERMRRPWRLRRWLEPLVEVLGVHDGPGAARERRHGRNLHLHVRRHRDAEHLPVSGEPGVAPAAAVADADRCERSYQARHSALSQCRGRSALGAGLWALGEMPH